MAVFCIYNRYNTLTNCDTQFVKPYFKSNKSDANDAEAISMISTNEIGNHIKQNMYQVPTAR